jgi:hypothetical protein
VSAGITEVVMAEPGLWAALGLARDHHNFSDLFEDEMRAKQRQQVFYPESKTANMCSRLATNAHSGPVEPAELTSVVVRNCGLRSKKCRLNQGYSGRLINGNTGTGNTNSFLQEFNRLGGDD